MERVLNEGPRFIMRNFLTIQKWEPNFIPKEVSLTHSAIWAWLPQLPTEFYDQQILEKIGGKLGTLLKIDTCTSTTLREKHVHICVKTSSKKSPKPTINTQAQAQTQVKVYDRSTGMFSDPSLAQNLSSPTQNLDHGPTTSHGSRPNQNKSKRKAPSNGQAKPTSNTRATPHVRPNRKAPTNIPPEFITPNKFIPLEDDALSKCDGASMAPTLIDLPLTSHRRLHPSPWLLLIPKEISLPLLKPEKAVHNYSKSVINIFQSFSNGTKHRKQHNPPPSFHLNTIRAKQNPNLIDRTCDAGSPPTILDKGGREEHNTTPSKLSLSISNNQRSLRPNGDGNGEPIVASNNVEGTVLQGWHLESTRGTQQPHEPSFCEHAIFSYGNLHAELTSTNLHSETSRANCPSAQNTRGRRPKKHKINTLGLSQAEQ
ncbi:hypothetical protein BC332_00980 [Capsicum chinense]|nr:hypothetical protein BC332_00980 [Capsicum chinense]